MSWRSDWTSRAAVAAWRGERPIPRNSKQRIGTLDARQPRPNRSKPPCTPASAQPRFHITQLIGRIAQQPVYRELPGQDGRHVTELRLAVKGMGSGDRDAAGYIDAVSYTMTEKAAATIDTGWLVAVTGRLEHQTWEKDGYKRSKHRIVASRVEFLAAPRNGSSEPDVSDFDPAADQLCVCGHLASKHAVPSSGDTRCLAVEDRRDLLAVFDDGRDTAYGYCACLRFQPATSHPRR